MVMVQTGAGKRCFYFSCECKMQMTPSCDSFMTAVDSLHCSQGRDPVTPIKQPTLLSDLLHIGSIIQRAHRPCTHFFPPSSFSCSCYFFWLLSCFHLPVSHPFPLSALMCFAPFIFIYQPFLLTSTSPLHLTSRSSYSRNHCFPLIWTCLPLWTLPSATPFLSLWDNSILPRSTDEKLAQVV